MKKSRLLSLLLAGVVSASGIFTAGADTGSTDIKRFLLLENDSCDRAVYDMNGDGTVDVFDMCRIKHQMVSEKTETASLVSAGEAYADYEKGFLYVPVVIENTGLDIGNIGLIINHDPSAFSLDYLEGGDFASSWSWAINRRTGQTYLEFSHSSDLSAGGTIVVARFNILPQTPSGEYEFSFSDIHIEVSDNGTVSLLPEDKCPKTSPVYRISVDTYAPPVTTPPSVIPPDVTEPGITTPPPQTEFDEHKVYEQMIKLKELYPEGMPWTNANGYSWNGGIYSTGYGCAGFAFILSDAAFGTLPARIIREYDPSAIRVGDILRVNNDGHSVVVLEINDEGVVIAEGNFNSSIHWGRKISWNELEYTFTYLMTRYPQ